MDYPVHNKNDMAVLAGGDAGVEAADVGAGRSPAQADASARKPMVFDTRRIEGSNLRSDRIVVLPSRPGRSKRIVSVGLPPDARRDAPEFNALRRRLPELIDWRPDPPLFG